MSVKSLDVPVKWQKQWPQSEIQSGGGVRFGMELQNLWHTNVKFYVCHWSMCQTHAVSFLVVLSVVLRESPKLFALMCFGSTVLYECQ